MPPRCLFLRAQHRFVDKFELSVDDFLRQEIGEREDRIDARVLFPNGEIGVSEYFVDSLEIRRLADDDVVLPAGANAGEVTIKIEVRLHPAQLIVGGLVVNLVSITAVFFVPLVLG